MIFFIFPWVFSSHQLLTCSALSNNWTGAQYFSEISENSLKVGIFDITALAISTVVKFLKLSKISKFLKHFEGCNLEFMTEI